MPFEERYGLEILQRAVDCCFFPGFEIEEGLDRLSDEPDSLGGKIQSANGLK